MPATKKRPAGSTVLARHVARLRAEQGLTVYALAQRLAAGHGRTLGAWRVDVERIETPSTRRVPPERIGAILRELGVGPADAAMAEVRELLDAREIGRLVDAYGKHAAEALSGLADVARMTHALAAGIKTAKR